MPVKVVPRSLTEAYKKREGDFSPNLVGLQATNAPLFTLGNFQITTNIEPKVSKNFSLGGEWSDYITLNNLDIDPEESKLLESNQKFIDLNFDTSKIERYAHFGSLSEFIRVNIEQIILNWKGSLYINKNLDEPALNTVLTYSYDSGTNISTFKIPESAIVNNFNLIYKENDNFQDTGSIADITKNFDKYFLWNSNGAFIIKNLIGTTDDNNYITLEVFGESWPSLTGNSFGSFTYHIRPLPKETNKFFLGLTDYQKIMMNTLSSPKYTFELEIPYETDDGGVIREKKKYTWPVSDGYNIDISFGSYANFLENLFEDLAQYDRINSDLISRKYTSVSIHEYDTPSEGTNNTGQKVQKLLKIYGRSFDDIKKYIDGISFANIVTYDKKDNTSDELIKIMAKNLGLDTLETIFGEDLDINSYNSSNATPTFSAYSRGLTPKEIETEYWRRLVINAWWLWKSKGTRKVLEFFLNMFGISDEFIDLNEYVYVTTNRLDTADILEQIEEYYDIIGEPREVSISEYPMDELGFPKPLPNTEDFYFQSEGGWYNGGTEITEGNNPHIGPYDFGSRYINRFSEFIEDQITSFTAGTVTTTKTLLDEGTVPIDGNGYEVEFDPFENAFLYDISTANGDTCDTCGDPSVSILTRDGTDHESNPPDIVITVEGEGGTGDEGGGGEPQLDPPPNDYTFHASMIESDWIEVNRASTGSSALSPWKVFKFSDETTWEPNYDTSNSWDGQLWSSSKLANDNLSYIVNTGPISVRFTVKINLYQTLDGSPNATNHGVSFKFIKNYNPTDGSFDAESGTLNYPNTTSSGIGLVKSTATFSWTTTISSGNDKIGFYMTYNALLGGNVGTNGQKDTFYGNNNEPSTIKVEVLTQL